MSKLRPKFLQPSRENAGIVIPEFVLHAALADLPEKLRAGVYGRDAMEERLFPNLSDSIVDACFNKLYKRPPSVSLMFPLSPEQLPAITIAMENVVLEAPIMADDAGIVEPEIITVTDPLTITPSGGAVGGEQSFVIPVTGELATASTELALTRGSLVTELTINEDFDVDAQTKTITLTSPLVAGDVLVVTRYASFGLAGGDLFAQQYRFNHVIFIDTENPTLTSVLVGIIWRELMLKAVSIRNSGLTDLDFSLRALSLWEEKRPAIAWRTELTVTGLCDWVVYERVETVKGINVELDQPSDDATQGDDVGILQMSVDTYVWEETESNDC